MRRFVGRSPWKARGITGYAKRTAAAVRRRNLDWYVPFDTECDDLLSALTDAGCPQYFQYPILLNSILRSTYEGNATVLRVICDMHFWVPALFCCADGVFGFRDLAYELRAGIRKPSTQEQTNAPAPNLFTKFAVAEDHYKHIFRYLCEVERQGWTNPCGSAAATQGRAHTTRNLVHLKFDDKRPTRLTGEDNLVLDVQLRCIDSGKNGIFAAGAGDPCQSAVPEILNWGFIKVLVAT